MRSEVSNWTEVIWVSGISEHTASIFKSFALMMEAHVALQHWYPHDYKL